MRPIRVEPDDEPLFAESYAVRRAAHEADSPGLPDLTLPELLVAARDTSLHTEEQWLFRDGGAAVGTYRLRLPTRDNLDAVDLFLAVEPRFRHAGRGRAILEHALDRVRAARRSIVWAEVVEPLAGDPQRPARFAAAAGFRPALSEVHRVLQLSSVDRDQVARQRDSAAAVATGYELVGWTGRCPDDLVQAYADLNARMTTDSPLGELEIEPEVWDVDRVRAREDMADRQGRTIVATAARPVGGGPLVAYTDIAVTEHDPEHVYQWDTLVEPAHRGHRLGLLLKTANLLRLLDVAPRARQLHTWNADSNTHMVAINEAMGFRPVQRQTEWQLTLSDRG